MGILLPAASGGRRDAEMGNPLAPYSANQRDCECGEKVPHHAAPPLLLHTEQQRRSRRGREGEEYCVFSIRIISLLSSAAAAAAAAGSTSSVRSFAPSSSRRRSDAAYLLSRSLHDILLRATSTSGAIPPSSFSSSGGFCGQTVIRARSRRPPAGPSCSPSEVLDHTSEPPPLGGKRSSRVHAAAEQSRFSHGIHIGCWASLHPAPSACLVAFHRRCPI